MDKSRVWVACALVFLSGEGCASSDHKITAGQRLPQSLTKANDAPFTPTELEVALLSFADRANYAVAAALQPSADQPISPRQHMLNDRILLHFMTSTMMNATEANPATGLIDTMVTVSLVRWALNNPSSRRNWGPQTTAALAAPFAALEVEIWELGGRVLSSGQLDELKQLIENWKKEHPDAYQVTYVRFREFERMRGSSPSLEGNESGMMAPVKESNRQIDEVRRLGERMLYVTERLPFVSRWQATNLAWEIMGSPDVQGTLQQVNRIGQKLDRMETNVPGWIDYATRRLLAVAAKILIMLLLFCIVGFWLTAGILSLKKKTPISKTLHAYSPERRLTERRVVGVGS